MDTVPQALAGSPLMDLRVGVFSPSGAYDVDRLERGMAWLRSLGAQVVPAPNLGRTHRYLAGKDSERRADLEWALSSPGLDVAWMARGGFGLAKICEPLPKVAPGRTVVGFSDGTALHAALWKAGLCGLHAPVLHSLHDQADLASQVRVVDCLLGRSDVAWAGESWIPGEISGPLVGGNLCMLASLAGTGLQPDLSGCILLLEEIAEPPYKLDRMLHQLLASGMLDGVVGVALGEFVGTATPPEWTLRELMVELLESLDVPVLANLPVGHGSANQAFYWGQPATLSQDRLELGALTTEPARGSHGRYPLV